MTQIDRRGKWRKIWVVAEEGVVDGSGCGIVGYGEQVGEELSTQLWI